MNYEISIYKIASGFAYAKQFCIDKEINTTFILPLREKQILLQADYI